MDSRKLKALLNRKFGLAFRVCEPGLRGTDTPEAIRGGVFFISPVQSNHPVN